MLIKIRCPVDINIDTLYRPSLITILLIWLIILLPGCNIDRDQQAARECAKVYHERFSAQNYELIYLDASQRFRDVRSKEAFVSMMRNINNEYGKLLNVQEEGSASIINNDVGKGQVFIFKLEFEKGKATERLTFTKDGAGQTRLWMFELS